MDAPELGHDPAGIEHQAGLHVESARAEGPAVFDAKRHPLDRALRPDRIEVAQHQGRPTFGWAGESAEDVVATLRVGDDLDRGAEDAQAVRQDGPQGIEGRLVAAGRLVVRPSSESRSPMSCSINDSRLARISCTFIGPCDLLHDLIVIVRSVRASMRSSTGSTPRPGPSNTRIAPSCRQDRRLDDVLGIILVRAGDIAG